MCFVISRCRFRDCPCVAGVHPAAVSAESSASHNGILVQDHRASPTPRSAGFGTDFTNSS